MVLPCNLDTVLAVSVLGAEALSCELSCIPLLLRVSTVIYLMSGELIQCIDCTY